MAGGCIHGFDHYITASLVESLILLLIFPRGVFTTYTAASDTEQGTQHVRFSAVTRVLKDFTP